MTHALGLADGDAFTGLVAAISEQDAPAALGLIAQLASRGADLRRFVADSLGFFRGIFLAQYAPNLEEITDEPPEILDEWRRQGRVLSSADVLRAIDGFSEALLHLRQGREERLVLELALIRLTRPETTLDGAALASRIERLEQDVKQGGAASYQPPASPSSAPSSDSSFSDSSPSGGGGPREAGTEGVKRFHQPRQTAPLERAKQRNLTTPPLNPNLRSKKTNSIFPTPLCRPTSKRQRPLPPKSPWPSSPLRGRLSLPGSGRISAPGAMPSSASPSRSPSAEVWPYSPCRSTNTSISSNSTRTTNSSEPSKPSPQKCSAAPSPSDSGLTTTAKRCRLRPTRAPEQDQLDDGPTREDPEDLIADMLGGTVVEE